MKTGFITTQQAIEGIGLSVENFEKETQKLTLNKKFPVDL